MAKIPHEKFNTLAVWRSYRAEDLAPADFHGAPLFVVRFALCGHYRVRRGPRQPNQTRGMGGRAICYECTAYVLIDKAP